MEPVGGKHLANPAAGNPGAPVPTLAGETIKSVDGMLRKSSPCVERAGGDPGWAG